MYVGLVQTTSLVLIRHCYCSLPTVRRYWLVSRIALVSPERSRQIEGILLRMAQTGQLRGRVTEEQLIQLLEQVCCLHAHNLGCKVMCVGRRSAVQRRAQEGLHFGMCSGSAGGDGV